MNILHSAHGPAPATTLRPARGSVMRLAACACLLAMGASQALANGTLSREPADGDMRLGQRVRVDDGTCPAGKIKEVTAAKLTAEGVARTRVCVKR